MEKHGKENSVYENTIKTILCTRLDFYVQELNYLQEREANSLPKKVLNQIKDSIRQAVRTKEEIDGWTVRWEMDVSKAHNLGAPIEDLSQIRDSKDYVIMFIGKLCEAIWEISRVITFDGKVVASPCNRPHPFPTAHYGVPNYPPPPGYGSPYPHPQYGMPGQFRW